MGIIPAGTKSVEESIESSQQPRAQSTRTLGIASLLNYMVSGSYRISPWWSPKRDKDLMGFVHDSDHLASAVAMLIAKVSTVPVRVLPRDMRLKKHQKDAEEFTIRLNEESEFGQGWSDTVSKALQDWWTSDNGMFLEIIGDGDPLGPIEGPALGIANLDAHRCQRTGNNEFPVIYTSQLGTRIKYHRSRIAFAADMPSAREEMYGVGFCAVSRVLNNAQILIDINRYKQEKLGSRPIRGMLIGKGIQTDAILDSVISAEEKMDSKGLSLFSQIPVLGDVPADSALELLSLVGLPDGYDEQTSVRLSMFLIALGFGVPIRWLWPAAVSGATKADAMYQHIAGLGGGVGRVLSTLTTLLGGDPRGRRHGSGKFLPPHLKLVFDFQDDEQDRSQAEIQGLRITNRATALDSGVIDVRIARENALEKDDISQAQFDRLELEDGRLPGGDSVLTLFHNTKEPFLSWLDIGVDNPLAITLNEPMDMLVEINAAAISVQDALANTSNVGQRERAEQALASLNQLKAMYAPLAQQAVQQSLLGSFGGGFAEEEPEPGQEPGQTPEVPGAEEGTKQFNWGVGAGEIIGGQLARGEGGQFINADQMKAQVRAAMLARMGGGEDLESVNSAALRRAQNRLAVAESLGIDIATLDALSGMRSGKTSIEAERALAESGLATVNPDGSVSLNAAGTALVKAANAGNIDAAEQAKAKGDTAKAAGKKPKGGGGGGKPKKPTKEEIQTENRQKTADQLGNRIEAEAYQNLLAFADGADLSPSGKQDLAQMGLVEIDNDGFARMTSAGKTLVSAANKADTRGAKDAISRAATGVEKALQRAEDLRTRADGYQENADEAIPKAQKKAQQYAQEADEIVREATKRAVKLDAQGARALEQAGDYDQRATNLEQRADALAESAADAPDAERAVELTQMSDALMAQAGKYRERASKERHSLLDFEKAKQDLARNTDQRLVAYQDRIKQVLKDAEEAAQEWQKRAEDRRKEADDLEMSIGGGVETVGLLGKALTRLKSLFQTKEKIVPRGSPLPPWTEEGVEISAQDIKNAIAGWNEDEDLPDEAKGLLEARPATIVEIAEAIRDYGAEGLIDD